MRAVRTPSPTVLRASRTRESEFSTRGLIEHKLKMARARASWEVERAEYAIAASLKLIPGSEDRVNGLGVAGTAEKPAAN
jgi:hypothetical protein